MNTVAIYTFRIFLAVIIVFSFSAAVMCQQTDPGKARMEKMIEDVVDVTENMQVKGQIQPANDTQVPSTTPILDVAAFLADYAGEKATGDELNRSMPFLLMQSEQPTATGLQNPFVRHTKGPFGTIPGTNLASSREFELARKILESPGNLEPADVFRMALEVTDGDYSSAMLTAHNLLKDVAWSTRKPRSEAEQRLFLRRPVQGTPEEQTALRKQYVELLRSQGLPFTLGRGFGGELEIIQDPKHPGILDKLADLRPSTDPKFADKIGPWYHSFGVLFLSSIAKGGGSTAELWARLESGLRHLPGFASSPDEYKEFLTNLIGDKSAKILDAIKDTPALIPALEKLGHADLDRLGLHKFTWRVMVDKSDFADKLRNDFEGSLDKAKLLVGLAKAQNLVDSDPDKVRVAMGRLGRKYRPLVETFANVSANELNELSSAEMLALKKKLADEIKRDCGPATSLWVQLVYEPASSPRASRSTEGKVLYGEGFREKLDLAGKRRREIFLPAIDELDAIVRARATLLLALLKPCMFVCQKSLKQDDFSGDSGDLTADVEFIVGLMGFEAEDLTRINPRFTEGWLDEVFGKYIRCVINKRAGDSDHYFEKIDIVIYPDATMLKRLFLDFTSRRKKLHSKHVRDFGKSGHWEIRNREHDRPNDVMTEFHHRTSDDHEYPSSDHDRDAIYRDLFFIQYSCHIDGEFGHDFSDVDEIFKNSIKVIDERFPPEAVKQWLEAQKQFQELAKSGALTPADFPSSQQGGEAGSQPGDDRGGKTKPDKTGKPVPEGMVRVPDIVGAGMTADAARDAVTALGLEPNLEPGEQAAVESDHFRVYEQQPAPGSVVAKGATVNLKFWLPND